MTPTMTADAVRMALKTANYRFYRQRYVHSLDERKKALRVKMAKSFANRINKDADFINRIWFTDETIIELNSEGRRGKKGQYIVKRKSEQYI